MKCARITTNCACICTHTLLHRRHVCRRLVSNCICCPPQARHRLVLRVERHAACAVETDIAEHTRLVAAPCKHGERHRDRHVHANLTDVDLVLKAAGCRTRLGEDGGTVAVGVGIDELKRVVESGCGQADERGAKDLLPK